MEYLKLKRELNIYSFFLYIKSGNHVDQIIKKKEVVDKSLKPHYHPSQMLTVLQVIEHVYNELLTEFLLRTVRTL